MQGRHFIHSFKAQLTNSADARRVPTRCQEMSPRAGKVLCPAAARRRAGRWGSPRNSGVNAQQSESHDASGRRHDASGRGSPGPGGDQGGRPQPRFEGETGRATSREGCQDASRAAGPVCAKARSYENGSCWELGASLHDGGGGCKRGGPRGRRRRCWPAQRTPSTCAGRAWIPALASSIRSCVTLGKSLNPFELIFSFEENEVRITAPASWNCGEE